MKIHANGNVEFDSTLEMETFLSIEKPSPPDRMKTNKHTATPWILVPQSDGSYLIAHEYETGKQMNPKGLRLIAFTMARRDSLEMDDANAETIVQCVNGWDALTAERDRLRAALELIRDLDTFNGTSALRCAIDVAQQSLTPATP